jgi:8-oxo-dGTP pyrophosphatase MutT (NUDIX family)
VLGVIDFATAVTRLAAALPARPLRALAPDAPIWPAPLTRAAVTVMLVDRGGAATVPMILRGDGAPVHGGQTALPGGRWEARDGTLVTTALREVEEELGVAAARLRVLGELDDLPTRTGFLVRPVIAVLDEPRFAPSPREVAAVFEVPLGAFADRSAAEELGWRELGDVRYPLRAYQVAGRRIWGLSARILEMVVELAEA